jgi:FkbM family methyltransferase
MLRDTGLASLRETQNGRVVLFGAGSLGQKIAQSLRSRGIEPLAFSDNSPLQWGKRVGGVPVLSPTESTQLFGENAVFVVSISSPGHAFSETQRQLELLGCRHIVPFLPLLWQFASDLLPYYSYDYPEYFSRNASGVLSGFEMMADEPSRKAYLENIRLRVLADFADAPERHCGTQYFADDLFLLSDGEVFLDAGAFDGDTLREFFARVPNGSALALEPDPENYRKLVSYVQSLKQDLRERVECRSLALGSVSGSIKFEARGGPHASISTTGEVFVDVARFDDLTISKVPTFLKFDIEGGEYEALLGASKFIASQKPTIAVCVYHRPDDLWRLPCLLQSLNPAYRFHLRAHDHEGWETVLYAVGAT